MVRGAERIGLLDQLFLAIASGSLTRTTPCLRWGSVRARATASGRRGLSWVWGLPLTEGWTRMRCLECGSEAITERPERTAQGYRRFRCRACGKQFNERSGG